MSVSTRDIRNVAVIGHNGTGKTNLIEQMLFYSGVLSRAETVESGKTTSDYTEEEIQRKISVHATLNSTTWEGSTINILDTPGTADFIGEAISAFRACEAALMIVDGREGAQIETIKLWRRLDRLNKPRAVFINKMDKERASFRHVIDSLESEFDAHFVPVVMALGEAEEFNGVINLIEDRAYECHPGGKETPADIPEKYKAVVEDFRNRLIENAAECTDELIEKYFEDGTLSMDDIRSGLVRESIPQELGSDLLCNLAWAHHARADETVMTVDFGTALTFSTVDAEGRVKGVAIVPGLLTSVNALFGSTAQLPQVELKIPTSVLGRNSEDSIRAGIMYGYAGLVESIIRRTEDELGHRVYVMATGGLSMTISPLIRRIDHLDKRHTLNGLRLIASLNL